ncbi:MAG: hypothetical protein JWR69_4244 [Pedosphaera sp.]|nr:hypothetical protein [Pedosphaera sp.]
MRAWESHGFDFRTRLIAIMDFVPVILRPRQSWRVGEYPKATFPSIRWREELVPVPITLQIEPGQKTGVDVCLVTTIKGLPSIFHAQN